ncbi:aminoacyl-tRNA hydrolase [Candidatus Falkowbacteria bacterium HGW-Falkowbacteria-2]|uniref:Aminoacyl-tRNA hydrolase n=1 Tax=Candidatus Falkowbacteria bacterium HGW-Falkowbacteria-2 TaxID=2013769 RepID=A0A2N2E0V2_9BACT|nr:MAG: aminoacyl-tRNA hydrolase [Candidatus Falkowbacteria bacterium HGW-Falkowbacteria-2]
MQIIIGLGNPGDNYARSRHNAAWIALDLLIGEENWRFEKRFNAFVKEAEGRLFVKPQTFMNNSGESAFKVLKYYHLLATRFPSIIKRDQELNDTLFVIHDDLDLELGTWKISDDSRSGGNKGVQSIINRLKTQKFTRLRLGIKTPLLRNPIPPEKFVLQRFEKEELAALEGAAIRGYETLKKSM